MLGSVFAGFEISHRELPTALFWSKVDRKIESFLPRSLPKQLEDTTYTTALLQLSAKVDHVELDVERPSGETNLMSFAGGGMTSFGDDLLLLPYDGHIYKAQPGVEAERTNLDAPPTNREAFIALNEKEEFKDYYVERFYVRYNDLKYFENDAGKGLLASYTEFHADRDCATNTVARLDFPQGASTIDDVTATQDDWEIIYRSSPCLGMKSRASALEAHMAGGRMVVTGPETVYLANGDYHWDGMRSDGLGIAQDPNHELGKVMRINIMTGESEMVSMGHRNMQGIAAMPDGSVYVAEHGPKGGDELNKIVDGNNYGWPIESYGTTYSNGKLPEADSIGRHDKFTPPEFAWMPSPAVSAMVHVGPDFNENWTGDMLVGSLVTQSLWRVRFGDGKPVYSEQIPIGSRVRALWQHSNGQVVVWTDNHELLWLTAMDIGGYDEIFEDFVWRKSVSGARANRLRTAIERCAECHSFVMADHERSPSLARIAGDKIASTSYEGYSDALKKKNGEWTTENLRAFISDPQAFAPGAAMPKVIEDDPETVDLLVDFLENYDTRF